MSFLPPHAFERIDDSSDDLFYQWPRFVTHIDDNAIAAVTQLYREVLPQNGAILDLMSSWVSHLPPEIEYSKVVGLGLNRDELAANTRLNNFVVQNLNEKAILPFKDNEFDGATICVSIQYLQNPHEVLREVRRVCKPDAPLVITFSNRCFPTKAVAVWQVLDDEGHLQLVESYAREAGWTRLQGERRTPQRHRGDPLLAVVGFKVD
jgi:SAM-dependent methyltransferase